MKNNLPLVSVLVPSFNREKYISETIESILASTYKNFEIIIVDDCSNDNTVKIANNYAKLDSRVIIHINDVNLGQFRNRNKAISLARGKYVKFLDSDDLIYPNSLEIMVRCLDQFPDAAFAIQYELGLTSKPFPFLIPPREAYFKHFLGGGLLFPGPSAVIFRKSILDTFIYEPTAGTIADTHLLLRIAAVANIVALPNNLIFWRVHNEQVSEEQRTNYKVLWERHFMNLEVLTSENVPLSREEASIILRIHSKLICRNFLKLSIKEKSLKKLYYLKKKAKLSWYNFADALLPNQQLIRRLNFVSEVEP